MANLTVGYIARLQQLSSFAKLGRRSLLRSLDIKNVLGSYVKQPSGVVKDKRLETDIFFSRIFGVGWLDLKHEKKKCQRNPTNNRHSLPKHNKLRSTSGSIIKCNKNSYLNF